MKLVDVVYIHSRITNKYIVSIETNSKGDCGGSRQLVDFKHRRTNVWIFFLFDARIWNSIPQNLRMEWYWRFTPRATLGVPFIGNEEVTLSGGLGASGGGKKP